MALTKKNTKNAVLGKTQLLSAIASSAMLAPSRLPIKELDADVFVKRMTLGERDEYFEAMKEVKGKGNVEAFIIALVDENNEPLFTLDDIDIVKTIPPVLTDAVILEFNVINRFVIKKPEKKDDTDQPQEDEDLKNS
ncbi:hypothetical protein [Psychrobacter sp. MES7-P7E]|uniref:hypothetical protein n=1 Tax=Psychrobacter sp. MES7-P7E TaxID=2058322 RepID=UPI000C7F2D6D|nr:hypothetical protein [Psychrobacter sp. MES7-P7E]PLT21281.1 hypothetical protein CXF62_10930 [Psychrobacter sp. MES7-P7E]